MARPTDYKPEYDQQAYVACKEGGFTLPKLAKLFGVVTSTVSLWIKTHPTFSDAVKKGRDEFNVSTAEDCLLKRLKGYSYNETTKEAKTTTDSDGKVTTELVVTKVVKKSVAPDTTAQIFFLKNRDPKRWRDKQEVEHSGGVTVQRVMFGEDGTNPE